MELTRKNLAKLTRIMSRVHGRGKHPMSDPVDSLILTILSQATNDRNRDRAFANLKTRFPTWDRVRTAPVAQIAEAIESAGLGPQKAPRIKAVLQRLYEENGEISLDHLREMSDDQALSYLQSFPGVGPKTAACVLLFGFDRAAFPVDTHILRIARRLGLVGPRTTADRAQKLISSEVSPSDSYLLHVNLIEHGRRFCRPARPKCGECPLSEECEYSRNEAD